jgi:2-polyprenyl-6-methoxyphenol hydroxylase-like FAD-dependent oxidoreductase
MEEQLGESAVTLLNDEAIVNIRHEVDDIVLFLEDKHLHAKLLIVADGVFSKLRGLVGIEADIHDYGEDGVVAEFFPEKSHQNEAWQWFGNQEILACLPKEDGKISIVWSLKRNRALQYANPNALTHSLEAKVSPRFGKLALTSPIARYPLYQVRAASLLAKRSLLLGDAAHAVHPLAGYGLNLTLGDLKLLQQALSHHSDPGHTDFLVDVFRKRQLFDQSTAILIDGLHRHFTKQSLLGHSLFAAAKNHVILKKILLTLALEDYF